MENNNAIAVQGPDEPTRIEDVKPTIEDGDSPKKSYRNAGRRVGRRRDDVRLEDG